MIDFLRIGTAVKKDKRMEYTEVYPDFIIKKSSDLMIRGSDFYAIWVEEKGLWSMDEQDVITIVDRELDRFAEENFSDPNTVRVSHMWNSSSGAIDKWHRYCQRQMRDNYHVLDETLIFSNSKPKKTDYATKKLSYSLQKGNHDAWDEMMSVLYLPEERHKIEWAIGSIVSGDSKELQKFMVLYGAAGTGKSTVLNVIQKLFDGYYAVFDAKALGSSNNAFALEAFRSNPLVAIQHDGDLSRIEDNTRLNSLVSHEWMTINEKFKTTYTNRFQCFLFMGTNKPVKITEAKSGLIRRLIDVSPSGRKLSRKDYDRVTGQINFELGAIAEYCLSVYEENPGYFDDYIPVHMLGASNDFYNFVIDSYSVFLKEDGVGVRAAWEMYKTYCEEARVPYPYSQRMFKEELKNYFWEFDEKTGFKKFRKDRFENDISDRGASKESWLVFNSAQSSFDLTFSDCPAQYATDDGKPVLPWKDISSTKLRNLDTSRLHYVKVPIQHIVIDFDIRDGEGNKSLERNLAAASKWPPTYAELSRSGSGIHLHYNYAGDVSKLGLIFSEGIEIKVAAGDNLLPLRRQLSRCNDIPIATISSGLPEKGEKVIDFEGFKNEKAIRTFIQKNLKKGYHGFTKPSVEFIFEGLNEAYKSGMHYDVSDLFDPVFHFAASSSHNADYCIGLVGKMHFKSEEEAENKDEEAPLIFFDVEVFPNLFLVVWKLEGENQPVHHLINPKPDAIQELLRYRLVGFNCRRYDNHILYGCLIGYSVKQLYELSQKIIGSRKGDKRAFFSEAYNLSYTDIFDFSATKQSLKKFEIQFGIHHQELGIPWDKPVPEDRWDEVADYCDNDVLATEVVFNKLKGDFDARLILADLAGMTANDTTNSLTSKIIFGNDRHPQSQFNYRDMGDESQIASGEGYEVFDEKGRPIFPGYLYEDGVSTYRGEEVGEGGYVYAEPGMYSNVALLDIQSMHPSSMIAEELFGSVYTARLKDILDARLAIKHGDLDTARTMMNGKLARYLTDESVSKDLAQALKIAINSIYGLTAAHFDNQFHDIRNKDNIVAKRGALFMINLKHRVQEMGFTVAHIKTDSIKIVDATPEVINFVMEYGKKYGYSFEHQQTYKRMCLVNNAEYIALEPDPKNDGKWKWEATGKKFAVPYLFKTLFSREPITFDDLCWTFNVTQGELYLDANESLQDVTDLEKQLEQLEKSGGSENDILELKEKIANGHNYVYIGKVGQFCPVKEGSHGGVLYRIQGEKKFAPPGSTGYRWLESEMVKANHLDERDAINKDYFRNMASDAKNEINKYGDFEWFVSDD